MNTKQLTQELLVAFLSNNQVTGREIVAELPSQIEREFECDEDGCPNIPEDIFLLLNTPKLRSIAYLAFLQVLTEVALDI